MMFGALAKLFLTLAPWAVFSGIGSAAGMLFLLACLFGMLWLVFGSFHISIDIRGKHQ